MSYSTLTAAKGQPGAIATWVNYAKLSTDVDTILDEAQALIYGLLRTREMKSVFRFRMDVNESFIDLPDRFLEPLGPVRLRSFNQRVTYKEENFVQSARTFTETSGTLANSSPFTTAIGSPLVNVVLANHGFTVGSLFAPSGAVLFNSVTIDGAFPIAGIVDTNNFTIDISGLGTLPSASGLGPGGGVTITYTCDLLNLGIPNYYGIWDERLQFETAFYQLSLCELPHFQSLPLLGASNETNFLTSRYPQLIRTASNAAAADYMKDGAEYQKHMAKLSALIDKINSEADMIYRGMDIDTITPGYV